MQMRASTKWEKTTLLRRLAALRAPDDLVRQSHRVPEVANGVSKVEQRGVDGPRGQLRSHLAGL